MLLPRTRSREKKVRSARLEYSLRIQRVRSANQYETATGERLLAHTLKLCRNDFLARLKAACFAPLVLALRCFIKRLPCVERQNQFITDVLK